MSRILVIDDEPMVREPISTILRSNGYDVESAPDCAAAMASIHAHIPDLILLDIRMPERDGISLLKDLRATPATANVPVLLLSSATDKSQIMQAAKLGVQGYMLKSSFSINELLDRVRQLSHFDAGVKACATSSCGTPQKSLPSKGIPSSTTITKPPPLVPSVPDKSTVAPGKVAAPAGPKPGSPDSSGWPRILSREQTIERLDQVAGGKTLAGVVSQLIAVANSPEANLGDVVHIVQSDPVLAARVLHLANSAATGSTGRVRSVEDAARNLGMRGIQNMAISIGIFGAFPPDERDGFSTMRCWQHSYAVAELLNLLLRERNPEQESLNHLIGLCHDLGEILLRQHFVEEYQQIVNFAFANHLTVSDVQSVALGIRHPELVSRLLSRIGLPASVVQFIREFFDRQVRGQSSGMSVGAQGLSFANFAAHGMLLAPSTNELVRPITRVEWRQFSPEKPPPSLDCAAQRGEFLAATNMMARLPAKEEERLLLPLIPRLSRKVLYVRPVNFIDFDPLAMALSFMCELEIVTELPKGDAWRDLDALIVVGLRPEAHLTDSAELSRAAIAAGRDDLPILVLVAQEIASVTKGPIQLRSYPVSLGILATWLGKDIEGNKSERAET